MVRRENPESVRCLIPTTRNVDVQICFRIGLTEPTTPQSNVIFRFEKHCTRASMHLSKDKIVSCLRTILQDKMTSVSKSTMLKRNELILQIKRDNALVFKTIQKGNNRL